MLRYMRLNLPRSKKPTNRINGANVCSQRSKPSTTIILGILFLHPLNVMPCLASGCTISNVSQMVPLNGGPSYGQWFSSQYGIDYLETFSPIVQALLKSLSRQFAKKDLRVLHYFLGIEVKFTSDLLCLTQAKYVAYLLKGATLHEANPCLTPVATGSQLSSLHGSSLSDPTQYHSLVGVLQYLTLIHLDISFAVNQVCQFMHQPTGIHWKAVKHILRYVLGTSHDGLVFRPGDSSMIAFSYANYDGNPDDCRFTGGYCIFFCSILITWSSKK
ncbi:transposable element gene [Prunus dulcis]|uniref:Transposable element protein n=1 Tax=Prunus dulcis TaxID=3755 RepID=A0A5H2XEZ4_PRUDU|nr:transposable element gene [Prunus dulcis]